MRVSLSQPRLFGYTPTSPLVRDPLAAQPLGRNQDEAKKLKDMGNEFRRLRMLDRAMMSYYQAIQMDPKYTDAYFNMAQLQEELGQLPWAIQYMTALLEINPDDHDARVLLGEYYEKHGRPKQAEILYRQVLGAKPNFDPARRNLGYLSHRQQQRNTPEKAGEVFNKRYQAMTAEVRRLLADFYTRVKPSASYYQLSQMIPLKFELSPAMAQQDNIAEYDPVQHVVRLQPRLLFSTPNVVGAYVAHELVHAMDKDSKTSIQEEQAGYEELTLFWQAYKNGHEESNLDKSLRLFRQSPDLLDKEVRNVYTITDPNIPERSPGHGLPLK